MRKVNTNTFRVRMTGVCKTRVWSRLWLQFQMLLRLRLVFGRRLRFRLRFRDRIRFRMRDVVHR